MAEIAFSHNGERIASVSCNEIHVSDTQTGALIFTITLHPITSVIQTVTWSPDGTMIASTESLRDTFHLWSADDGREIRSMNVLSCGIEYESYKRIEFSPDSARVYCQNYNHRYIFDCATGERLGCTKPDWQSGKVAAFKEVDGWIVEVATQRRLCWITGSRRPHILGTLACSGNWVVLSAGSAGSGRLTILDLSKLVNA